jgi:hypothetical protein
MSKPLQQLDAAGTHSAGARQLVVCFVEIAVAEWWRLVAQVSDALGSERRHRKAIEEELFHGRYTLSSKNDDDLPVL